MTLSAISRQVPLDRLVPPDRDVRSDRDPAKVRSLAASMGDPDVGQQQPITVYPAGHDDLDLETEDDLADLYEEGHDLVIHDGMSRLRAAQQLGWTTLWAVLVPEPPEEEVIARLEANTENLDMSDFEVYSALHEYYQETAEVTLEDVGEKVGVSASYISNVFGLFDSPDWLREAWANPDHPLETSHALAVKAFLSENTQEEYARAGGLDDEEAYQRALEDARLMIDVQADHSLGVTDFRQRCKRCKKETLDQLQDDRTREEKQADGQTARAEARSADGPPPEVPEETCLVCGDPADRKIAVDVCREDYGLLSDMKAQDDVLMAQAETQADHLPPTRPEDSPGQQAVEALAEVADISPDQAEAVVQQVQEEASQAD